MRYLGNEISKCPTTVTNLRMKSIKILRIKQKRKMDLSNAAEIFPKAQISHVVVRAVHEELVKERANLGSIENEIFKPGLKLISDNFASAPLHKG